MVMAARQRTAVAQLTPPACAPGRTRASLRWRAWSLHGSSDPAEPGTAHRHRPRPSRADRPARHVFTDLPIDHHRCAYRRL